MGLRVRHLALCDVLLRRLLVRRAGRGVATRFSGFQMWHWAVITQDDRSGLLRSRPDAACWRERLPRGGLLWNANVAKSHHFRCKCACAGK